MEFSTTMDPAQLAQTQRHAETHNAELKAKGIASDRDLGQDKYLKLLVTQLRYQDPQNPLQNHEFAAQMAQFSALEQMTKMNSQMEKVISSAKMGESYNMLGKEVSWLDTDTKQLASGIVKAIVLADNRPMLRVGNVDVDPAKIAGVRLPQVDDAARTATARRPMSQADVAALAANNRMAAPQAGATAPVAQGRTGMQQADIAAAVMAPRPGLSPAATATAATAVATDRTALPRVVNQ